MVAATPPAASPAQLAPSNTGAGNSDYQRVEDLFEFNLSLDKGKITTGKFVLDLKFSERSSEQMYFHDPEDDGTYLIFELTKRPPKLDEGDLVTVYIHLEENVSYPQIDDIVLRSKVSSADNDVDSDDDNDSDDGGSTPSISDIGRDLADQLKNAAKGQLDKLNPLKGLFGKK
jgi:hypothetical protein